MTHPDPNADLIGFEYTIAGDPPTRWRVTGTDTILGANYVALTHVGTFTSASNVFRVQNAGVVRRGKMLEEAS